VMVVINKTLVLCVFCLFVGGRVGEGGLEKLEKIRA